MAKGSSNGLVTAFADTVQGVCFGGACVIKWLPQNILSDARAEWLTKQMKDSPEYSEVADSLEALVRDSIVGEWGVMLSCMRSIEADGTNALAGILAKWFDSCNFDDPGGLWFARLNMPYVIFREIRASWTKAQAPINPPEKLPGTALSAEQLEQLKDPNSPLAEAAGNGGKGKDS